MGVREKGYHDYGLNEHDVELLKKLCKDKSLYALVKSAAQNANFDISNEITCSLVSGLSYRTLECRKYIPISEVDFYAYRRKALWLFSKEIKEMHNGAIPEFLS